MCFLGQQSPGFDEGQQSPGFDKSIINLFSNPETVARRYIGLAALMNTASALVAWSAKTENPDVKMWAQYMIAAGMSYGILHGASEYDYALFYFLSSWGFNLANVWSYDLSLLVGYQGIEITLIIAAVSFLITCACDKKISQLCHATVSGDFFNLALKDPFAFLRLWKNFFGAAKTGAFSMIGASSNAALFVEWMSFIEPIVFINIYCRLNYLSEQNRLACPSFKNPSDKLKIVPWLVLVMTVIYIITKDGPLYFDNKDMLPFLALMGLVGLVYEATGILFTGAAETVRSSAAYFTLPNDTKDIEDKESHDPKIGPNQHTPPVCGEKKHTIIVPH